MLTDDAMTTPSDQPQPAPHGPLTPASRPEDVQATFVATLVDEWVRCGLRHAVVCPGSRSAPLALAFADRAEVTVHVHPDERSGSYLALGIARSDPARAPVAIVTTSGTAAAELHPAVIEAHQAGVPLLVCTADRPPELRDVGAPQTVDQAYLYGRAVRWFADPGVADLASASGWRAFAARALAESIGSPPGPVHLNLPFREPLVGTPRSLPEPRHAGPHHLASASDQRGDDHQPWTVHRAAASLGRWAEDDLVGRLVGRRGLILAGEGSDTGTNELAAALGWPVAADPRSRAWDSIPPNVQCLEGILRSEAARSRLQPEVILRLGEPPASRVVNETMAAWCASGAEEIVISSVRWSDPAGTAAVVVKAAPAAVARELLSLVQKPTSGADETASPDELGERDLSLSSVSRSQSRTSTVVEWQGTWRAASEAAAGALEEALGSVEAPNEPTIARELVAALAPGTHLLVSSSLPIRDVERYAVPRGDIRVVANRGANGIDGVVSTAVGVAAGSGSPAALLVGDLAFLHDSNGLIGAARRGVDLVIVVVDNDGGGIFSFLPQARQLSAERFEQLFGTPHGLDLAEVARAFGVRAERLTDDRARDLPKQVAEAFGRGGVQVLVVPTDRSRNVEVHRTLDTAVAKSVEGVFWAG